MTQTPYTLAITNRSYSSWSLRGWLLFEKFNIPVRLAMTDIYTERFARQLEAFWPTRTVPALELREGGVVCESLAIAEELASRHPDAGLWPEDPSARARARSLAAEMHAGFPALRRECPHNMRFRYDGFAVSEALKGDLSRLELLWSWARSGFGGDGPWLFGKYSIADAFYAPVATRITTYGLPVGPEAQAYVAAHLADPAYRRWRAQGQAEAGELAQYELGLPRVPWPEAGPTATAVPGSEAENAACPYSGRPVTHVLEYEGRRWGFCNAVCRDKTALDPTAWPEFMAMTQGTMAPDA